jgi:hypothetical protein
MRSASSLAALSIVAAVLLSGCVPQEPEVVPPPEPTTEPVFATDEEALAAATDAYKAYLAMSDLIAQEGGKEPERLEPYVTAEIYADEKQAFEAMAQDQVYQVGSTTFENVALQSLEQLPDSVVVSLYVCLDLSRIRLIDQAGDDTRPTRADKWPFEAVFDNHRSADSSLILIGHEQWSGSNFCI